MVPSTLTWNFIISFLSLASYLYLIYGILLYSSNSSLYFHPYSSSCNASLPGLLLFPPNCPAAVTSVLQDKAPIMTYPCWEALIGS